jgi:hypothetical protein
VTGAIRLQRGEIPKRQQLSGIHEPKPEIFEPVTEKMTPIGLHRQEKRIVQRFLKEVLIKS